MKIASIERGALIWGIIWTTVKNSFWNLRRNEASRSIRKIGLGSIASITVQNDKHARTVNRKVFKRRFFPGKKNRFSLKPSSASFSNMKNETTHSPRISTYFDSRNVRTIEFVLG